MKKVFRIFRVDNKTGGLLLDKTFPRLYLARLGADMDLHELLGDPKSTYVVLPCFMDESTIKQINKKNDSNGTTR